MRIGKTHYRTIWPEGDGTVSIIDQTLLPHRFETLRLSRWEEAAEAISVMRVRGAPLIGAMAAYGYALAAAADPSDAALATASDAMAQTRPTAVNLRWALGEMARTVLPLPSAERARAAFAKAAAICDEDVASCSAIGDHGLSVLRGLAEKKRGAPLNILTHCNAGWLAAVDWGMSLSPIYKAHHAGIPVHVWVDETRPRNQGAALTAFELQGEGVPHTVIADNAGGALMQDGKVDLCITGADRVAANGDAANKIGTYLKALAARDNAVPFYVAFPYSTIDWSLNVGVGAIPIEERSGREVTHITGRLADGALATVEIAAPGSQAANPAFDVTPARLITGLITERGLCAAGREGLIGLYPERNAA
jgi:methylthioribose-1-phosphate isomerase